MLNFIFRPCWIKFKNGNIKVILPSMNLRVEHSCLLRRLRVTRVLSGIFQWTRINLRPLIFTNRASLSVRGVRERLSVIKQIKFLQKGVQSGIRWIIAAHLGSQKSSQMPWISTCLHWKTRWQMPWQVNFLNPTWETKLARWEKN